MLEFDYAKHYPKEYFFNGALCGMTSWNRRTLKFGDSVPAISYALGISWEEITSHFTEIYPKVEYSFNEDHPYTIEHIEQFLTLNKKRNPTILEIGGGRGELSCMMTNIGIPHTSVEACLDADEIYRITGNHFYGDDFKHQSPIAKPFEILLESGEIDLKNYDTLMFVESIEHIPTENINYIFSKIVSDFTGRLIITNDIYYHPIIGSLDDPDNHAANIEEHVATIDDDLYDSWCKLAKRTIHRNGSHLVLEF